MDYKILHEALSRKRAHESDTDAEFAGVLIAHLASFGLTPERIDSAGNIYYQVGESRTLFAAHIDTAHHMGGVNTYKLYKSEKVRFKKNTPTAWEQAAFVTADGDCLGADDGAGVMLLCWLMQNHVPGHYVFTRGEECGGIGATYIADNYSDWLRNFDRAICFDRRDYSDVITHQGGQRCASDAFGEALSEALNEQGLLYMPSDKGIYTDCKEWIGDVSEGVNLSVGYFHEHGDREWLNLEHLRKLAKAVIEIDWENLPTERDPSESTFSMWSKSAKGSESYPGLGISEKRINELYTKELTVDDYEDVVHLAIDGEDSLLTDLVCNHFGLSMRDAWVLDFSGIKTSEYVTAANMRPEAGLKWLYEAATTEIPH